MKWRKALKNKIWQWDVLLLYAVERKRMREHYRTEGHVHQVTRTQWWHEVWGETGLLYFIRTRSILVVHQMWVQPCALCICITRAVDWLCICCNRMKSKLQWRVGLHQESRNIIIIIIKYQCGWEAWQTCAAFLVSDMRELLLTASSSASQHLATHRTVSIYVCTSSFRYRLDIKIC